VRVGRARGGGHGDSGVDAGGTFSRRPSPRSRPRLGTRPRVHEPARRRVGGGRVCARICAPRSPTLSSLANAFVTRQRAPHSHPARLTSHPAPHPTPRPTMGICASEPKTYAVRGPTWRGAAPAGAVGGRPGLATPVRPLASAHHGASAFSSSYTGAAFQSAPPPPHADAPPQSPRRPTRASPRPASWARQPR